MTYTYLCDGMLRLKNRSLADSIADYYVQKDPLHSMSRSICGHCLVGILSYVMPYSAARWPRCINIYTLALLMKL